MTRSTAEERRGQFLQIARQIIETEGVEALRPTRVAELAGCTRPLIYQYFPRREDIFIAITEELYAALDAEMPIGGQRAVLPSAVDGNDTPARAVIDRLWAHLDEKGPAALILRSTPEISADFRRYLKRIRESHERRWLDGFREVGMEEERAELMLELFLTSMKVLALQYLAGKIDRSKAIERHIGTIGALVFGVIAPRR